MRNNSEKKKTEQERQITKDAKKRRKNRQNSKTHRSNEALLDSTNEVFLGVQGLKFF